MVLESALSDLDPELAAVVSAAVAAAIKGFRKENPAGAADKTIGELWAIWEPHGEATISSWKICLTHKKPLLKYFGDLPWYEATPGKADDFRLDRGKQKTVRGTAPSPTYLNRMLTTLHSMLGWHAERKTIPRNPLTGWARVNEEPYTRQTILTDEEFAQFIAYAHPRFQDIATVAMRCVGMRNSEARLLRKEEVRYDQMVIVLGAWRNKNRKSRIVPMDTEAADIIRRNAAMSRGPYVFVSTRDPKRMAPVPASTMQNWLEGARKKSGMHGINDENIVVHTLRHSAVTTNIAGGMPVPFVQAAAGMSAAIIRKYTKWQPAQQAVLREFQERRGPMRAPAPPPESRIDPTVKQGRSKK